MRTLVYDGSFPGWLSAVFDVYEYKFSDVSILPQPRAQHNLFGDTHVVHTDEAKAVRVWKGLQQKISPRTTPQILRTFLSEETGMEDQLLRYAQYVFSRNIIVENDFSHPAVLYITDTARKVHREKHRMEAFVRFQQTKDNLYYAIIDPDFNVLPLIKDHFERRYADQHWMIYDTRRKYGLHYDGVVTNPVEMNFVDGLEPGENITTVLDEKEELYRQLWQQYFTSVNIAARKNIKLHIRHMPLRYWKYLPEKQFLLRARS
jgi:probable DNA metabolism protein